MWVTGGDPTVSPSFHSNARHGCGRYNSKVRIITICLGLIAVACAPEPRAPRELVIETEDVGAPVDSELSTDRDEKGRVPVADDFILSGEVPEGLPLHRPARLVGSGEAAGGRSFLVFHASAEPEAVRGGLARRLPDAGWATTGGADTLTATRGPDRVVFTFGSLDPGTEIRVEY